MTLDEAIARLNDKHNHTLVFNPKQLAGLLTELKELREENEKAKRLLKSAINVLKIYRPCGDDICSECINYARCCEWDDYFEWKYLNTPELKKIIGE